MLWLLLGLSEKLVWLLFKGGHYSRVVFIILKHQGCSYYDLVSVFSILASCFSTATVEIYSKLNTTHALA